SPHNGVPDFVDLCAESFEKAYQVIVLQMGFKKPYDDYNIKDNGGDEKYDVYLFSGPWLGFTMPEFPIAVGSTIAVSPFYFGINSRMYEFVGVSEGKRYLETTCAHEFLHSVQFAYNYYMYRWFMEVSCTWIERVVYDGMDFGETDGNNYYNSQLTYWFRYPDWSLTKFDGWHEYGSVIWAIFLTERYDMNIIKDFYEDLSEGTYRELANFYEVLSSRGTNLGAAFKEFTVWNYFTSHRYDERFYSRGKEYPLVSVHLDNIHQNYPVQVFLDTEKAPENLGARYIRFLPAPGQKEISIKIDGMDITAPDDMQSLDLWGTRGWGAKLIIYKEKGPPKLDEIFLFQMSQEGQMHFKGFGTDIKEIVLVLSNLHPDLDISDVSYSAGPAPSGRLSEPSLTHGDNGEIRLSWDVLDDNDISEVAIIRKRFAYYEGDTDDSEIKLSEVYSAKDEDGNGLSDSNINIVGKVPVTSKVFTDNTVFSDIQNIGIIDLDPYSINYYYAVVPINKYGIMGTPAIAKESIIPKIPPPTIIINTKRLAPGEWEVYLWASQPLVETPDLITIIPDGRRIPVIFGSSSQGGTYWKGRLSVKGITPLGTYRFSVLAKGPSGNVGTVIRQGREFVYDNYQEDRRIVCYPNPFNPGIFPSVKFHPNSPKIRIFNLSGKLIKELSDSQWDGTDENQQPVARGIYIYIAEVNGFERKGKILVTW
ncbi:T9SS type A sorting domain-containing protein, partial [Candidatus Poribacteria bacterium]|nr:T9SS type A sorting domain-containing protein [Candidatus Poribacteria bacterium]